MGRPTPLILENLNNMTADLKRGGFNTYKVPNKIFWRDGGIFTADCSISVFLRFELNIIFEVEESILQPGTESGYLRKK